MPSGLKAETEGLSIAAQDQTLPSRAYHHHIIKDGTDPQCRICNKYQETVEAINTCAVSLKRYGAGVIKWKKGELQKLDRRTRKLMAMHKIFNPDSHVDRLYLPRRKGGRGFIGCEDCQNRGK